MINKYNENNNLLLSELNDVDYTYHKLLLNILNNGVWKQNRTGIKTISIFGPQIKFYNIGENFPIITTKKIILRSVIGELLWFLSGSTNKFELKEKYGVGIWDNWGDDKTGEMGPIYGHQWVNWNGINQLQNILNTLKTNPDDRRMIVSSWNVPQIKDMALPPCHWSYQFYSAKYPNNSKRTLHLIENQRSVDTFLGLPFNIVSYALLLMMIAQEVDMIPGNLIMNLGDTHIYENHLDYIHKQLKRKSKDCRPVMQLNKNKGFWEFESEDFKLLGYDSHPNWKGVPIAV